MFFFKEKINQHLDCLQSAIRKKENNNSLSNKSLMKLINVVSIQYDLKHGEANFIFGQEVDVRNINHNSVSRLIKHFKEIKSSKSESFIKNQISAWEDNANKLLIQSGHAHPVYPAHPAHPVGPVGPVGPVNNINDNLQLIGKGTRGDVYRDGDLIIKKIKNFNINAATHEVNMCNEYYKITGRISSDAIIIDKHIKMPFVKGPPPCTFRSPCWGKKYV